MKIKSIIGVLIGLFFSIQSFSAFGQESKKTTKILSTRGLVAVWDFSEEPGQLKKSLGKNAYPLKEMNGSIARIIAVSYTHLDVYKRQWLDI